MCAVTEFDLQGTHVRIVPIDDGSRQWAMPAWPDQIGRVCASEGGTANGHMWRFTSDAPASLPPHEPTLHRTRAVLQMDGEEVVRRHESIKDAAAAVGANLPNISAVLAGGWMEVQRLRLALRGWRRPRAAHSQAQEPPGRCRGSSCGLPFVGDMTWGEHVHAKSEC